jgi:raffinose/stachyose/melibiose transport system substrate-binding protein
MRRTLTGALAGLLATSCLASAAAAQSLVIESWRNDDADIWNNEIIPAFEAEHPEIDVSFSATPPADYNAALNARLQGGTAGDLITCRPFDASLTLYEQGHLVDITDLPGMENFSDVAKSAWTTDDGAATFCVPMASVIHGFIYNAEIFDGLGLEEPQTVEEFFAVLDAIAEDGQYVPLAMGTADQWEAATMGFQNIGPAYWKGEEGRQALISGEQKLTDEPYVQTFATLARWGEYMGPGFEAQTYPDSQTLFTLGRAAIYPAGSWDISVFRAQAAFDFGAFPPPTVDGACYISDHTDIGLGINAASENQEAAQTFLEWMTGPEFAQIFANELPGFFPLGDHEVTIDDPVAQEFVGWRDECERTIRNSYQILSRGTPNLENELWGASANVINGDMTPEEATQQLQEGLESWYEPQQN